jgi:DNA-cytosine methyltransferase
MHQKPRDIAEFRKQATLLRKSKAESLAKKEVIDYASYYKSTVPEFNYSYFEKYLEKLPLSSGRASVQFNCLVTEAVLLEHVLKEDDPYTVTFLAANVIEQSFYQIFDPVKPSKPLKNLSVAKHFGIFFTPPHVAKAMVFGLSTSRGERKTLLDPCVGSGVLLCAALLFCNDIPYEELVGIELDPQLARWAQMVLNTVASLTGFQGDLKIKVGDGLDYLLTEDGVRFPDVTDIIINPPYGRLRLTQDRETNKETRLTVNIKNDSSSFSSLKLEMLDFAKSLRSKADFLAKEKGTLEYSRVFFRACAELSLKNVRVSIISPDSWMSGRDSVELRKFLLENKLLSEIILLREDKGKFSTVNQATSITLLNNRRENHLSIYTLSGNGGLSNKGDISYGELKSGSIMDFAIPRVSGFSLEMFQNLSSYKKFQDIPWIRNARGEIDQTFQKEMFSAEFTTVKLIRGEHVERFSLRHSSSLEKPSFLKPEIFAKYIEGKPKNRDYKKSRIIGRQCSYAQQARRLIFCRVPECYALGNSCNYISVDVSDLSLLAERQYLILGLLNSSVLDWFFRVENSNNHVGNYEIAKFPFPENETWFPVISSLAYCLEHRGLDETTLWMMDLLEAAVGLAYDMDPEVELQKILENINDCNISRAINFAKHLKRGVRLHFPSLGSLFFNHSEPTLSALDRQMISYVPEGGNWQNIPEEVPSKRLDQIRQMTAERGGIVRTTYYGRLKRNQPSYTINTYFNRPGNGTHIHPLLDRTVTSREAARLQSFPDKYLFLGSEGAVRNQIGNAVPPLLATAIGKHLAQDSGSRLCADVFCGAGGLSLGLELAGWETVCAVDNDSYALDTYCFNRLSNLEPQSYSPGFTSVFNKDLHESSAIQDFEYNLQLALNGRSLDLLVGGPPCQGFSYAGYRSSNDKRNNLTSSYLYLAEKIRPRIFLLENVEGLLTFNKGQVLEDICNVLKELGYRVTDPVWKLYAEQYGVPQMRRRVFVVATTDSSVDLSPPPPTHAKCAGRREDKVQQANLFDFSLAKPHTVAEAFSGLSMAEESNNSLLTWLTS